MVASAGGAEPVLNLVRAGEDVELADRPAMMDHDGSCAPRCISPVLATCAGAGKGADG
jgi:hypothetical protein